jgi:hypothetical protein
MDSEAPAHSQRTPRLHSARSPIPTPHPTPRPAPPRPQFGDRSRIELNERRALVRKGWAWSRGNLSLGLGAECAVQHTGLVSGWVGPRAGAAERTGPEPELALSMLCRCPAAREAHGPSRAITALTPHHIKPILLDAC